MCIETDFLGAASDPKMSVLWKFKNTFLVRIGSPGKPKGQFPVQIRGFLGPGPSVLARTLLPLPAKPENHCTAYYPSEYPFQRPLGGGVQTIGPVAGWAAG